MNSNENLRNKELLPTTDKDRTMSLGDYIMLWAGMTINIVAFSLGAQYYNNGLGLSPWMIVFVMTIGYGFVTILTALIGDIGTKYGVPFATYARAPFGYKGSYIAGLIRAVPGVYWFGFLTWIGAEALNTIIGLFIPGFDQLTLLIIIFAGIQILNTMYGLEAMAKFDWVAIPALTAMFAIIMYKILNMYNITIGDIMATPAEGGYSIPFAISGIAGGWITMALNGGDLTRQISRYEGWEKMTFFQRNKKAILGQVIGLMVVGVLTMLVGAASGITTGFWDLNDVIPHLFSSKMAIFLSLVCVVFAQWSTNTAANLMPPTMVLLNMFPKLKFSWSAIICGIIGIAIMPWKLQSQGGFLVMIQNWISQMLGPIIGIMLIDYFIIRKTKVNVHDLFVNDGQYKYGNGYNMSAIVSLFASFGIGLLFGDYGFYVGLVVSMILYYFLMTNVTMKKYPQNPGQEKLFDKNN